MSEPVRIVLLDRDDTIVAAAPPGQRYLTSPEDVTLLPGVREAVARLNRAEIVVAVVTNQRGIATGVLTWADCQAIHDHIADLLAPDGRVDAWLVCPHDVGRCTCRKPAPGLVLAALTRFAVPAAQAVIVGNAESDLLAGAAVGVRGLGVGSEAPFAGSVASAWLPSLPDAVERILLGMR